jgi:predicted Zn finger-like uncharacterized protein
MNVSCTSCSAKYAIPDEKVRGKKVKITCKHCGTGIVVDGTKLDLVAADTAPVAASLAPAASSPVNVSLAPVASSPATVAASLVGAPAPATPSAALAPAAAAQAKAPAVEELRFDIAYPDERQETLSVSEIVSKYAAGTLDDDAFIWREGMPDWKAPFEIPELAQALSARGLRKKALRAAASPAFEEEEATRLQLPTAAEPEGSPEGEWREPAKERHSVPEAAFNLTPRSSSALPVELPVAIELPPKVEGERSPKTELPSPAAAPEVAPSPAPLEPPKPAAARRSAARGGADLFGDLAAAGSEADDSLGADGSDGPRLTGARNESSVLFSLDALVKQEKTAPKKAPARDDAAAFLLGADMAPSSVANLSAGQFGSALAAPDFTAPVSAFTAHGGRESDPVAISTAGTTKKGGAGVWLALGAVVLAAGGAVAAGLPAKLMGASAPPPSAQPAALPEATPAASPAASAPEADSSAAPAASSAPSVATAAAPATTPATPASPTPAADGAAKPQAAAEPAHSDEKPAAPEAPPERAEPQPTDSPPFDKAAAIAALTAAAASAQSCKTPDGPAGSGKVAITFMPSGRATNTQVSGDLAGTAVGGCVARIFRSAKVPAFSGDAVTVSKSFSVE